MVIKKNRTLCQMKCHFSSPQILLLAHEPLKSPNSKKYMTIPDCKFSLQKPITGVGGENERKCSSLRYHRVKWWTCIFFATPFCERALERACKPIWGLLISDPNITSCISKSNSSLLLNLNHFFFYTTINQQIIYACQQI